MTRSQALEVVEQSSKPVVITDQGVEVMGSVGPYLLGQSLILVRCASENLKAKASAQVCMAEGEPAPEVIWTRDGTVWDEEMDPGLRKGEGGQRRNTLVVSPLEREHAGNRSEFVLSCCHGFRKCTFSDFAAWPRLPTSRTRPTLTLCST